MPTSPTIDSQELLGVPRAALPRHIAIIMDGNGRWARQRNLPRIEGHRSAGQAVRDTIRHAARLGIECMTLYSFSRENWKRPADEVNALMALYAQYLADNRAEIMDNDLRLRHVGRSDRLPASVLNELNRTAELSANNQGMHLCLALDYGSRTELVDAVQAIARRVLAGEVRPEQIDEALIDNSLYTAGLPDPDLVIRTAGQLRLSNFLLWQISYAELYVTDTLWPDFRIDHLNDALRSFAGRERRYGDVAPAPAR